MKRAKAEAAWHRLGWWIAVAMFGMAFAITSGGCPGPGPVDEQPTETVTPDASEPAAPDVTPDTPKPDTPTPDTPKPDITPDAGPDVTPDVTPTAGSGEVQKATPTATKQLSPLDAMPSPDGKVIYYTAFKTAANDPNEPNAIGMNDGALFKINADGSGAATELASGFQNPTGLVVSKDGTKIYVADSGTTKLDDDGVDDADADKLGGIYTVPAAGGNATLITGTNGYQPKSLDVVSDPADQVYFSGVDPADDQAGIFRIAGAGGNVNVVSKDAKIMDPSGVAVAKDGTVYFADTIGGTGGNASSIFMVKNGTLTEFVTELKVGYPAGIALSQDENFLLVSGLQPEENTSVLHRIDIAKKEIAESINKDIGQNSNSAGLHRAHNADLYAWANASAPDEDGNGGGTVYLLNTKANP